MQRDSVGSFQDAGLLRSVAQQLTFPLTAIARQAELSLMTGEANVADVASIQIHAQAALTLVEGYMLGLSLLENQNILALEPVSVSAVLTDVAHELDSFAKQHDTRLRLHIAGRYEPVMAHAGGLRAALLAIGYALLESYPLEKGNMTLAVHRTPRGIITGLYGDYERLSAQQWRKALLLKDKAAQPFHALVAGNGAGLFVADSIMRAMETTLRVGKHLNQQGLATTLQPSQQLQFV